MKRFLLIKIIIFIIVCIPYQNFAATPEEDNYDPTTLVFPTFLHTYGIRKATRFHLFLFTKNKVKFNNPQGLAVVKLVSWDDSTTKKDDDEVTVYGVNSGQNCIIYNTSMKSLGIYGLDQNGKERLKEPTGIAANSSGDVYVADTGNNRIVKLHNPGHDLFYVKDVGGWGNRTAYFKKPVLIKNVAEFPLAHIVFGIKLNRPTPLIIFSKR